MKTNEKIEAILRSASGYTVLWTDKKDGKNWQKNSDISQATLYGIGHPCQGGILSIVEEKPVRGMEKVYAVIRWLFAEKEEVSGLVREHLQYFIHCQWPKTKPICKMTMSILNGTSQLSASSGLSADSEFKQLAGNCLRL